MSLSTDTNIDIIESLDFEMDDNCEHSQHNKPEKARFHSGRGEWWRVNHECPRCGNNGRVILVCEKFKQSCESLVITMKCGQCGIIAYADEFEPMFVRKDEL